ncbi:hypothetical protein BC940DRAFT_336250 [Gongronella butleri]|nr:hypothetical protein BC940DRAFT_336250 [Gongronella butleri]
MVQDESYARRSVFTFKIISQINDARRDGNHALVEKLMLDQPYCSGSRYGHRKPMMDFYDEKKDKFVRSCLPCRIVNQQRCKIYFKNYKHRNKQYAARAKIVEGLNKAVKTKNKWEVARLEAMRILCSDCDNTQLAGLYFVDATDDGLGYCIISLAAKEVGHNHMFSFWSIEQLMTG